MGHLKISKLAARDLSLEILEGKNTLINNGFCGGRIVKNMHGILVTFDLDNAVIVLPFAVESMNDLKTVEDVEKLILSNNEMCDENADRHYEQQERFYTSGAAFERD